MGNNKNNKRGTREERATRDDVARLAGVSGATVSRVFNRRGVVEPATADRVMAAARKLNYFPNTAARNLTLGKSHAIGVLLPSFTPAYSNLLLMEAVQVLLTGIADAATSRGYLVTLLFERDDRGTLLEVTKLFRENRIDGIIILGGGAENRIVWDVCRQNLPHVIVGGEYRNMPSNEVSTDMRSAIMLLVRHLADLGHRRIGLVCMSGALRGADEKMNDFRWAMSRCNLEPADEIVRPIEHVTYETCYETTKEMLDLPARPTAIIADSRSTALPVLSAIRDKGLNVPADVSLVGFAPTRSDILDLPWTQVNFPILQMGRRATELVIAAADGETHDRVADVLSPELFVGTSSAAPPLTCATVVSGP